jgi:hypothetical protein
MSTRDQRPERPASYAITSRLGALGNVGAAADAYVRAGKPVAEPVGAADGVADGFRTVQNFSARL